MYFQKLLGCGFVNTGFNTKHRVSDLFAKLAVNFLGHATETPQQNDTKRHSLGIGNRNLQKQDLHHW